MKHKNDYFSSYRQTKRNILKCRAFLSVKHFSLGVFIGKRRYKYSMLDTYKTEQKVSFKSFFYVIFFYVYGFLLS